MLPLWLNCWSAPRGWGRGLSGNEEVFAGWRRVWLEKLDREGAWVCKGLKAQT